MTFNYLNPLNFLKHSEEAIHLLRHHVFQLDFSQLRIIFIFYSIWDTSIHGIKSYFFYCMTFFFQLRWNQICFFGCDIFQFWWNHIMFFIECVVFLSIIGCTCHFFFSICLMWDISSMYIGSIKNVITSGRGKIIK